jgi:hypothetical protein
MKHDLRVDCDADQNKFCTAHLFVPARFNTSSGATNPTHPMGAGVRTSLRDQTETTTPILTVCVICL